MLEDTLTLPTENAIIFIYQENLCTSVQIEETGETTMANDIIHGMGFHHIAMFASDFEKSLAFYQALGMKPYTEWGEGKKRIMLLDVGNGDMLELFAKGGDE